MVYRLHTAALSQYRLPWQTDSLARQPTPQACDCDSVALAPSHTHRRVFNLKHVSFYCCHILLTQGKKKKFISTPSTHVNWAGACSPLSLYHFTNMKEHTYILSCKQGYSPLLAPMKFKYSIWNTFWKKTIKWNIFFYSIQKCVWKTTILNNIQSL